MDWLAGQMDRLSIALGVPPWIVVLTLFFIVVLFIGVGAVMRDRAAGSRKLNWDRDPDEIPDLSPALRQARLQMIGAGIAIVAVLIIAGLSLLQG